MSRRSFGRNIASLVNDQGKLKQIRLMILILLGLTQSLIQKLHKVCLTSIL